MGSVIGKIVDELLGVFKKIIKDLDYGYVWV